MIKTVCSIVLLGLCWVSSCSIQREERENVGYIDGFMDEELNRLKQQNIYFGHQSVGADILNGVQQFVGQDSRSVLSIVRVEGSSVPANQVFAHASIGRNQYPDTKIEAFSKVIREGVGQWADLALFKFCYVDVTSRTDVNALFDRYRDAVASLKREYPGTVFVHVTVPLVCRSRGWKDVVKRILGRKLGSDDDNIRRNEYNQRLLKEYEGKEPVFDLAMAESSHKDGTREFFTYNGIQYFSLAAEYASDGAHLNELGKQHVAEQFIVALAKAAKGK